MSSKKSTKPPAETSYNVRDIVLAKVKGYPPWPAMVVDPEAVGKHIKKERPISKKTTFYCVRFFPAGDYSWAVAKDLSRLLPHEMESYVNEPSKKNPDLKRGYEIALNPTPWEEDLQKKQDEYDAAVAEEEEGMDQLEDSEGGEDEVDGEKKKRKRKREGAVNPEEQKKKRKSAQEALSAKRRPIAGSKRASKSGKASSAEVVESEDGAEGLANGDGGAESTGSGKRGSKAKSRTSDADKGGKKKKADKEDAEDGEDAALINDPEAQRVKEWRHKLQRAFLTGSAPTPEDMPGLDQIFATVEKYELTIQYLQYSKIGKVMRRIAQIPSIPRDDEFKFKDRAQALVTKWQAVLQTAEAEATGAKEVNGAETAAPKATSEKPVSKAKATSEKPVSKAKAASEKPMSKAKPSSKPASKAHEKHHEEKKDAAPMEKVAEETKDDAMDMSDG